MAKRKTQFACVECGSSQARWMGKCPACGAWDTLEEVKLESEDAHRGLADAIGAEWADAGEAGVAKAPVARPIAEAGRDEVRVMRMETGIGEFDRVLGGGIVAGSVVLLGGDPGIGKSTLLLQSAGRLAESGTRVLYATSEESAEQVRDRARRLGAEAHGELFVLADTNVARIMEQARQVKPRVLAVDSIQMVSKVDLDASPGSMTQLRRCALELAHLAKRTGMAVVLVGHVTKDGELAGPRFLEHLVDAVLSFEGERYRAHRLIRSVKNRYGSTLELGVFEMTGNGLREVPDGSSVAANEERTAGSVVCPVMTGSRCLLVEVQALVAPGFPGAVKRRASGVDTNRLAMLIAVLEQHGGLRLHDMDVFASAVGGLRVVEPAADVALALAIAGAHRRVAVEGRAAAAGEVGLSGEVRAVPLLEGRVREAARLGYRRMIVPAGQAGELAGIARTMGVEIAGVRTIGDAVAAAFD